MAKGGVFQAVNGCKGTACSLVSERSPCYDEPAGGQALQGDFVLEGDVSQEGAQFFQGKTASDRG